MTENPTRMVEEVARESRGRLLAILSRRTGDLAAAEDALQRAFLKALEHWPRTGAPDQPEAWLLTTAKRSLIDGARKSGIAEDAQPTLLQAIEEATQEVEREALPERRLELLFVCAHPAIDPSIRAPLMLNVIFGATAAEIARCWITKPEAMAQRLVRAKAKIKKAGIPFAAPPAEEREARIGAVLDAIYAALTIGSGFAEEAVYLAALVNRLLPHHAEAAGLRALALQTLAIRGDQDQPFVPFSERETSGWDRRALAVADDLLTRTARRGEIGRYQLEAAITSAHVARAVDGRETRAVIVHLYQQLLQLAPSIGAVCGYAAALIEAGDKAAASEILQGIAQEAENYQPFWAVRAEILAIEGNVEEANLAWRRAADLAQDPNLVAYLLARAVSVIVESRKPL